LQGARGHATRVVYSVLEGEHDVAALHVVVFVHDLVEKDPGVQLFS